MTHREAGKIFGSVRKLEAAKAELLEAQHTQTGGFWDLKRVVDDIEEIQAHLRLIAWAERITAQRPLAPAGAGEGGRVRAPTERAV